MQGKKPTSKYYVEEKNFSSITSPDISYILGLLWADGYLSDGKKSYSINILANRLDLEEVLPLFNKVGVWSIYERNSENRQPRLQIHYSSKSLWELFKDYGYADKSICSAETVLKHIPDPLKHYWFRGYFDGDGSIRVGKTSGTVTFTGAYKQDFTFIKCLLKALGIDYNECQTYYERGSFSQINFSGKEQLKIFYDYVYKGSAFGFSRKREKFEMLPVIGGR